LLNNINGFVDFSFTGQTLAPQLPLEETGLATQFLDEPGYDGVDPPINLGSEMVEDQMQFGMQIVYMNRYEPNLLTESKLWRVWEPCLG
jgi:hypothetical protein